MMINMRRSFNHVREICPQRDTFAYPSRFLISSTAASRSVASSSADARTICEGPLGTKGRTVPQKDQSAYSGERDRQFRRNVTVAHGWVLRGSDCRGRGHDESIFSSFDHDFRCVPA